MIRKEWNRIGICICGILLFLIPAFSFAEEFPTKPINVLVAYAPGGIVDISIRILAGKAEKFLGQPFLISNNGGGAGSVATGIVAKQKPDGYHLLGGASTSLIRVPQFRDVPYKPEHFVPVMHYGSPLSGVAVKADSPWKILKELVEYARKNPGKVTYSTSGAGGPHHLSMEFVAKQEGIQWTHIPYQGGTPGLMALLGGHVTANVSSSWIIYSKEGSVRALATHGEKRSKAFPNVPTFREAGYDFINETVFLFAAPRGTPPSIIKKLDDAFRKAMDEIEFIQGMERLEIDVDYRNSADTGRYLEEAYVRLGKMIADLKIPREVEKK